MWWPLRYLWIVGTHPSYMLAVLGAAVGLGIWTVGMNAADLDSGLGMVLFVQMFLASSGFTVRARRGHFDALLVRVPARWPVAVAHLIVSVAPGVAGWVVVAAAGAIVSSPTASSAIVGGRMAALLIVSLVAWTAGFMLPRGAAAMAWLGALIGLLVERVDLLVGVGGSSPPPDVLTFTRHVVTLVGCPFLLMGTHPPLAAGAVAGALCVAVLLALGTLYAAGSVDFYLIDRS